jgi:23S rRNA pseudouridine2605 synthase
MGKTSTTRLNKVIAESGIASRRKADQLIEEGEVTVNGKRVYELGIKVDPAKDRIFVSGKPLKVTHSKIYIALHKPQGVLTTMEDPLNRPTIAQYVDEMPVKVFPVGRLDWDSEGLLVLTNDGDFAQRIMHPKHEVTKTYLVKLQRDPNPDQVRRLLRGVTIMGGKVAAKSLVKVPRGKSDHPWYKIIITEGKNRQIRQMFEKINNDVLKLQRIAIGCLKLGKLQRGQWEILEPADLKKIFIADDPEALKEKKSYKATPEKIARKPLAKKVGTKKNPTMKTKRQLFGD